MLFDEKQTAIRSITCNIANQSSKYEIPSAIKRNAEFIVVMEISNEVINKVHP